MILSVLLCLSFTGSLFAQSIMPDTLLFVFKLHGQLSPEETVYFLSRSAYKQLKEQQTLVYNQTTYSVLDSNERALGYPLIHVKDTVEGCEMWILDNPKLALVWKTCNNPLGVNWEVK